MRFELTADQRLLQTATADYLEKSAPLGVIRALHDEGRTFDRVTWRRGAELGWTSFLVPEETGAAASRATVSSTPTIIAEQFGAGARPDRSPPSTSSPTPSPRRPTRPGTPGSSAGSSPARCRRLACFAGPGLGRRSGRDRGTAPRGRLVLEGQHAGSSTAAERTRSSSPPTTERPHPVPGARATPRRDRHPAGDVDLVRGSPRVHFDRVTRPGHRARRRGRRCRGRRRAPAPARRRAAVRRDRRRHRPRASTSPSSALVRPLLLRPAARVLPGAQAPHRRHEDRGSEASHGHRRPPPRGRGRRRPRRRRARQRRPRPTSASTPPSSSRTASSCTAASASPGSTTSTSSCAASRSTAIMYGTPAEHRRRIADR